MTKKFQLQFNIFLNLASQTRNVLFVHVRYHCQFIVCSNLIFCLLLLVEKKKESWFHLIFQEGAVPTCRVIRHAAARVGSRFLGAVIRHVRLACAGTAELDAAMWANVDQSYKKQTKKLRIKGLTGQAILV